jgi:hypothetical protein
MPCPIHAHICEDIYTLMYVRLYLRMYISLYICVYMPSAIPYIPIPVHPLSYFCGQFVDRSQLYVFRINSVQTWPIHPFFGWVWPKNVRFYRLKAAIDAPILAWPFFKFIDGQLANSPFCIFYKNIKNF